MEVLLRWRCTCQGRHLGCQNCHGRGYREQWLPVEMLDGLKKVKYIILDRRESEDDEPA